MRSSAIRADLLMLLTALIWGTTFVAQRLGMDAIGPLQYTGLRFSIGALLLVPLLVRRSRHPGKHPLNRRSLYAGMALGLVLTLGINLQQIGLLFTSVTHSGFITGLYVIMVPFLGLLFGMKTQSGTWLGAILAVIGMALLSIGPGFSVASGDWLQLAGAVVWGAHVLLVGYFAIRHDAITLAVLQFATCAMISLMLAVIFEEIRLEPIVQALPALIYGGALGVATGFTLQVVAQRQAIASHAAIILSLEAVFAALAGALILGENLSPKGYLGCALMLMGMLVAQLCVKHRSVAQ